MPKVFLTDQQRELEHIKSQIRAAMALQGISQEMLSDAVGKAQNTLSNYLGKKGKINPMQMELFVSILDELGLAMEIRAK